MWCWRYLLGTIFVSCSLLVNGYNLKENHETEKKEETEDVVFLLFMFLGLTSCGVILHVLSRYQNVVPYAVVIFVYGVLISGFFDVNHLNAFHQSLKLWLGIDADLILYIFLPILVFGESMNLNWHHLEGAIFQSWLLAFPGVAISTFLTGTVIKYALPYHWTWNLALTFGAITSATDTVAVVSILKEAGSSPKLTMLIVGESLMNDGMAIVLFTIFFELMKGKTFTPTSMLVFFLENMLGSPLIGAVFGFIAVRWMRHAHRALKEVDTMIQIIITICCAYTVFFFAQYTCKVSGVLACFMAGVMLAWLAPPIILNHETMHNVWGFLEWICNSLIFLIAGLIMGHRIFQYVSVEDWFIMIGLYILLMVVRSVTIAILFPLLSNTGSHRCSMYEAIFMSWAGLRGAVAIALALIVENSDALQDEKDRTQGPRLLFYVAGTAAISIVVNGISANYVLVKLGLGAESSDSKGKKLVMQQIRKRLQLRMTSFIANLEENMTDQEKRDVRKACSLFKNEDGSQHGNVHTAEDEPIFIPPTGLLIRSPLMDWKNGSDALRQSLVTNEELTGLMEDENQGLEDLEEDEISRAGLMSGEFSLDSAGEKSQSTFASHGRYSINRMSVASFISLSRRGPKARILPDLLAYVRTVFLELVRVKYWQMVESGKLPRLSHSTRFLLYTVDVGLEDVKKGLSDWKMIEQQLEHVAWYVQLLSSLINFLPIRKAESGCICGSRCSLVGLLAFFLARREKRAVYLLTSFIEAHEHAQQKLRSFLGGSDPHPTHTHSNTRRNERPRQESEESGGESNAATVLASHAPSAGVDNDDFTTPEEVIVKKESMDAIARAKEVLALHAEETIQEIKSKQIARIVLTQEVHYIKALVQEGLLSQKLAETFVEEIAHDEENIEAERNNIHKIQTLATIEKIETARQTRQSFDSHTFAVRPSMTLGHTTSLTGNIGLSTLQDDILFANQTKDLEKGLLR